MEIVLKGTLEEAAALVPEIPGRPDAIVKGEANIKTVAQAKLSAGLIVIRLWASCPPEDEASKSLRSV